MLVYNTLLDIKSVLADINVTSLEIGLEPNLRPQDFPLIRIVSNNNTRGDAGRENFAFTVFFGDKLQDKLGMQEIYRRLYEIEEQVRVRLDYWQGNHNGLCRWASTESDEDRFEGYKAMACRFEIDGMH